MQFSKIFLIRKFIPKKTVFNFNYLFFILSIQMITTIIAVDLGAVFGLIEVKPLGKQTFQSKWTVLQLRN